MRRLEWSDPYTALPGEELIYWNRFVTFVPADGIFRPTIEGRHPEAPPFTPFWLLLAPGLRRPT